jgi:hypothetical protein
MSNPNRKVSRGMYMNASDLAVITTWVDATGAVRPFPVAHPGEIVGELVEHAQATGYKPKAVRDSEHNAKVIIRRIRKHGG